MNTDREVLIFLHERLVNIHKESDCVGYMHRLRGIIAAVPPDRDSGSPCTNSLRELLRQLPRLDALKAENWLVKWARRHIERLDDRYRKLPALPGAYGE